MTAVAQEGEASLAQNLKIMSCLRCDSNKRSCNKVFPECDRCVALGKECVYRHTLSKEQQEAIHLKRKEKRRAQAKRRAMVSADLVPQSNKRATVNAPTVKEMAKGETILDELFVVACLENFDKYMGRFLKFRKDLAAGDVKLLHSTVARSVRSDAIMSLMCRTMGWATQQKHYQHRAHTKLSALYSDKSSEAFSALSLMGLSSSGKDLSQTKILFGHSIKKHQPTFEIDLRIAISHYCRYFEVYTCDLTQESKREMFVIRQSFLLRANHIRRSMEAKLTSEEIASFGPWDYAHQHQSYTHQEVLDEASARWAIAELDRVDEKVLKMWSHLTKDDRNIVWDRHSAAANAVRCLLHYRLGEWTEARRFALATFECYKSVASAMWFFYTSVDLYHTIDVCIGLGDTALYEKGMAILRRMAPVYPAAERLLFALADVWPVAPVLEQILLVSPSVSTDTTSDELLSQFLSSSPSTCLSDGSVTGGDSSSELEIMLEDSLTTQALDTWLETR